MIRVLIVDDEPLARDGIRARLAGAEDMEVVGECAGGRSAIRSIRELTPDLVYLDVQMPGVDGFGVIEAIGPDKMPVTVFITAFDQHAIRAFEAQALDYLLKPIDDERFERTLERVRRRVAEQRESYLGRRLSAVLLKTSAGASNASAEEQALPHQQAPRYTERFIVRNGVRLQIVNVADVDWVSAEGNYVRLHAGKQSYLLRDTMGGLEEQLDPAEFVRIHRSAIVRTQNIVELESVFQGEYLVTLKDGTRLTSGPSYRDQLERAVSIQP